MTIIAAAAGQESAAFDKALASASTTTHPFHLMRPFTTGDNSHPTTPVASRQHS